MGGDCIQADSPDEMLAQAQVLGRFGADVRSLSPST
jgi:hypothetical protein